MKRLLMALSIVVGLFSITAQACPSAPFVATDSNGNELAKIQGSKILTGKWEAYSTSNSEDGELTLTRFREVGAQSQPALWRYEYKTKQPGIVWGVWKDSGMMEGFVNIYKIRTDLRSAGQNSTLVKNDDGSYQVSCR